MHLLKQEKTLTLIFLQDNMHAFKQPGHRDNNSTGFWKLAVVSKEQDQNCSKEEQTQELCISVLCWFLTTEMSKRKLHMEKVKMKMGSKGNHIRKMEEECENLHSISHQRIKCFNSFPTRQITGILSIPILLFVFLLVLWLSVYLYYLFFLITYLKFCQHMNYQEYKRCCKQVNFIINSSLDWFSNSYLNMLVDVVKLISSHKRIQLSVQDSYLIK